jgi:hypothetical protein
MGELNDGRFPRRHTGLAMIDTIFGYITRTVVGVRMKTLLIYFWKCASLNEESSPLLLRLGIPWKTNT